MRFIAYLPATVTIPDGRAMAGLSQPIIQPMKLNSLLASLPYVVVEFDRNRRRKVLAAFAKFEDANEYYARRELRVNCKRDKTTVLRTR